MVSKAIIMLQFVVAFNSFAGVKRISETEMDRSRPNLIYMTPGRSTLLDFPCEISHAILGLTNDIKMTIGPDSKKTMSLWLSSDQSQPTNLTVKCDSEIYVFDIYPNSNNHQDYLNIIDSYDKRVQKNRKLISSSESARKKRPREKKKLISSSKSYNRVKKVGLETRILKELNKNQAKRELLKEGVYK